MTHAQSQPLQEVYKPYKRCMVMGGGGFRFGIYIGMYAALRQAGKAPDILLDRTTEIMGDVVAGVTAAAPARAIAKRDTSAEAKP